MSSCHELGEYQNYKIGYKNPCFSQDCYLAFVKKNIDYYSKCVGKGYYDLYDNKFLKNSFSKRFFDITQKSVKDIPDFYVDSHCTVCQNKYSTFLLESRNLTGICSNLCKYKRIGFKKRQSKNTNCIVGSDFDFSNFVMVNHFIYQHKKYPIQNEYETNLDVLKKYNSIPYLKLPKKNYVSYYSSLHNLYFYCSKNGNQNTLKKYLNSCGIDYVSYHINNNLVEIKFCLTCNKKLLNKDVFGKNIHTNIYCQPNCYYKALKDKKYPNILSEEALQKQSKSMKKDRRGKIHSQCFK